MRWDVGEGPVGIDRQRAMQRRRHLAVREGISVGIAGLERASDRFVVIAREQQVI